jgi:hypothetical protein
MQDHVCRHQSDTSGVRTGLSFSQDRTHETLSKGNGAARSTSPKTKSRRIIVRVTEELYQTLLVRSRDSDCDLSHVVRSALDGSLKPESAPETPRKPLLRPEEIDPLVDDYRAVVDDDIRKIRKRRFDHLLAVSYVCKEKFPSTPWIQDGYQSLLELQHLFGYPKNV